MAPPTRVRHGFAIVERLHDPAQRTARSAKRPDEQDTRLGLVVRPLTEGKVVVADVQGSAARAGTNAFIPVRIG